jgi:hypothetical protein
MAQQKMSREARNQYRKANTLRKKEQARKEAEERNAARAKRSKEEQLALLDSRPGNSKKEREKLMNMA